jgi:hypothetical protein
MRVWETVGVLGMATAVGKRAYPFSKALVFMGRKLWLRRRLRLR